MLQIVEPLGTLSHKCADLTFNILRMHVQKASYALMGLGFTLMELSFIFSQLMYSIYTVLFEPMFFSQAYLIEFIF